MCGKDKNFLQATLFFVYAPIVSQNAVLTNPRESPCKQTEKI